MAIGNHLKVVTTTCNEYADCFGFTEEEVFAAMDEYGYTDKAMIKEWYDGFVFGKRGEIYNPWSILNYLDTGEFKTYWANTSSNSLISKLLRESDKSVKTIASEYTEPERFYHGFVLGLIVIRLLFWSLRCMIHMMRRA